MLTDTVGAMRVVLPHPIQYQGSKRVLAARILAQFPAQVHTLYEPFAGSAALSIAAAAGGHAERFAVNDLNRPLALLLERIVNQPRQVADRYEALWQAQGESVEASVQHFNDVRERFNASQSPEHLLFLLSRCIKGAVRYNREGQFNQSPDKRRRGTRPETMRRNILGVSSLLKGRASFTSLDYAQAVADATPADVIYMDPPYQGVSGERDARYVAGLDFDAFVAALESFNARGLRYMVSYDGSLGARRYGVALPAHLRLKRLELIAGRSSQATLLGRDEVTVESLYLSPVLLDDLAGGRRQPRWPAPIDSLPLFHEATNETPVFSGVS